MMKRHLLATSLLLVPCVFAGPPAPQKQFKQLAEGECYDSLDTIFAELEADDLDLEATKRYVLCPDTVFELGVLEVGEGIVDGQTPIVPRSNTEFFCGEDGSSSNNCVLSGGDFGFLAFGNLFFPDEFATNVVVKGVTFDGQIQSAATLQQPGNFLFEDCIFQNSEAFAPLLVNYEADEEATASDEPTSVQATFKECLFQGHTQRAQEVGVEFGVFTITGEGNDVELDDCIFQNNNYGDFTVAPLGYGISVGGENGLVMKNSCIMGNDFLGAGPLVLNPQSFFVLIGNYADSEDVLILCQLAARFRTEEDRDNLAPQCVDSQTEVCQASIYEA